MFQEIYILDLVGTFAFAIYGSYFALKKDFDILGIGICAFLTALGGGTLREIILDRLPFYFFDANYILMVIFAVGFAVLVYRKFQKIEPLVIITDAIGLVTFAFIGSSRAAELDLGILAIITLATVSAVAGGVMRDIVLMRVPEIMHRDFYASVAIVLGLIYGLNTELMNNIFWANALIIFCLAIRLLAIHFKINLWHPRARYFID